MKRTFKCGYKHCLHGGEVDKNEAVKDGTRYYHIDCLKEKNDIQAVFDLYVERVDATPIFTQLRSTINEIVYKRGCKPEFLLFALKYYLDMGKNLNYPAGLYYVVKNEEVKKAWEKKQSNAVFAELEKQMKYEEETAEFDLQEFKQKQTNNRKKISNILGV